LNLSGQKNPIWHKPWIKHFQNLQQSVWWLYYGPGDQAITLQFPAGVWYFPPLHSMQTGSATHPTYSMDNWGSFLAVNGQGMKLTTHLSAPSVPE